MAKTKLFELINSMSMSEKRFFKIFSSRHVIGEENDYVKLFDLIDDMDQYDESIVRKAPFVKNSSAEKNYLYRLILKSLNAFHAQSTNKLKIYDYLISVEILFQKGLYEHALSVVDKALQLAKENELFRQELLLSEIKQEILLKGQDYNGALNLMGDDRNILQAITDLSKLTNITTKGYIENLNIGSARSEDSLSTFNKLINEELKQASKHADSKRAKLHQISATLTYNMIAGNNDKVKVLADQILEHYHQNSFLIEYTPIGYINSLFIKGNSVAHNAEELEEMLNALLDAANLDPIKKSPKAKVYAQVYGWVLQFYLMSANGDWDKAASLIEDIESALNNIIMFVDKPQLYDLYFQIAHATFRLSHYKKALKYTNLILNDIQFKARENFMNTVNLFNLIIHFELGNDFTLEYLSKSTYNYLKRKKRLFEVERLVIKFIEKQDYISDKDVKHELTQKLVDKLSEMKKDKFEQKAFNYFDYLSWAKSKI